MHYFIKNEASLLIDNKEVTKVANIIKIIKGGQLMSCQYYSGMCNCCPNLVKSTAIALTGGKLVITLPSETLENGKHLCVVLAQDIPTLSTAVPVAISVNGTSYTIVENRSYGSCGTPNYLYSDQLMLKPCGQPKSRQLVGVKYGSDTKMFMYTNPCKTLKPTKGITVSVCESEDEQ